jgi:phage baseplate assembly protein W
MALTKGLYKGYSSFEFERTKSFGIEDIELVKLDLLNHIFTKRGTRVMMPTFGSVIPELVFEPLDADTLEILEDELKTVFDYDPRVELLSLNLTPDYDRNTVIASAVLLYVQLNMTDTFELNLQFEE